MSEQGKLNIYVCRGCGRHTVTIDKEAGVTPFMIVCSRDEGGCGERMQSSFYRVYDQVMRPDKEWYRPGPEEYSRATTAVRDHIDRGGLLLRQLTGSWSRPDASVNACPVTWEDSRG